MPFNYSLENQPFQEGWYNKHDPSLDGSLLTGIFTIKDGIKGGYPFVECILSILPFCDKLLFNDGGSSDSTLQTLKRIKSLCPEKIEIFNIEDKFTRNWRSIDYQLNELIKKCRSEWIFEIQGDEILDEHNATIMLKEIRRSEGFNALRHSRLDYNPTIEDILYDMRTIRIVRNVPNLTSYTGGDDFQIGPHSSPRAGYTLHNVPPERDVYSFVLKHYIRMFSENVPEWVRRHAMDLASDNTNRLSIFNNKISNHSPRCAGVAASHVPSILKDMVGQEKYFVREDLFK